MTLADMATLTYDFLVLGRGAEVTFFGTEGAAELAFPMYTLCRRDPVKERVLGKWEAADEDPSWSMTARSTSSSSAAGQPASRAAGTVAEFYRGDFAKDYPGVPPEKRAGRPGRGGPGLLAMCKPNLRVRKRGAREARPSRSSPRRA